jgi:exodeoxyribonuclease VII small subunit
LENDSVSVDELTEKMKRATVLLKICRDKLTKTEEEVNKTIAELS